MTLQMEDRVILTLNKVARLKMEKVENNLEIYYSARNPNTQRQENKIAFIIKFAIAQYGS